MSYNIIESLKSKLSFPLNKLNLNRKSCYSSGLITFRHRSGFTIVELLVVIVVIGILATITIVAYTGVTQKAVIATLEHDLSNAQGQLSLYQFAHGSYPTAFDANDCPSAPIADTSYCLKSSSNNSYTDYVSNGAGYTLTETNTDGTSYYVSDNSPPAAVALVPTTFVMGWGVTSSDSGDDYGRSIVQTGDGGYAITGYLFSESSGGTYMIFAKYGSDGTLSWSKTWGGANYHQGDSLVQTSDDGYAVVGYMENYITRENDMFLSKYTSDGSLSWSKAWGGTSDDSGRSIVEASDGGLVVTGSTSSYTAGSGDMLLAKYTSDGSLSWSKTWGGVNYENGSSLVKTSDNGFAVTGYTDSYTAGGYDVFLAKYTSDGSLSWSKTWGGASNDIGNSLVQTSDGGYAVTGYTYSYTAGQTDMFLAKYTSDGTLSWSKTWGGTSGDYGQSLIQTTDGGYAVTGYTYSYTAGGSDMFLAKYNSDGNLSWSKTWGGTGGDSGYSLVQTSDGGIAVTGHTGSYTGGSDMLLAKYASDGTITNCSSPMCQDRSVTSVNRSVTGVDRSVTGVNRTVTSVNRTETSADRTVTSTVIVAP